ncbi:MAG: PEP/pyruvate-binding domain-containing protein [Gammaproteobacteria bacterium]|nr:PEP/pyruvate-binding domain-containing protein [Gammaproteobacteria bacterium]
MNEQIQKDATSIGYKAAKLNWLKTQLNEQEQKDFCVLDSRHFTHDHALSCLEQTLEPTLRSINTEAIAACYKQKKLTPEIITVLQKRRELVREKLSSSGKLKSIVETEIIKLFSPNTYLILRSSSNEDIKGSPNAGGNETRQGVKNEWDCIKPELIRVLCSYFSEDSLNQQLQTATCLHEAEKLLTTLPTLAVLIQTCLRTEQNNILITGNLISVEPITNTPNIVTFQAGFGAEVGTRPEVPADKYTVMSNDFIIPSLKNKSYRLESRKEIPTELVRVKSNFELATRSTLKKDHILKLSHLARRIKQTLGCDVEIEFAIQTGKIALLQVREYQQNTCAKPQYLSNTYFHESPNHRLCTALTSMKEHVIVLKKNEVFSGFTAAEAVRQYAALPDKTKIKAIFVTDRPGLLSHPMVNFQHWGVPVYYVDTTKDNDNFTKLYLVIDFQRQELINTDTPPDESDIENGWHSMPFTESISSDCGNLNDIDNNTLKKYLPTKHRHKLSKTLFAQLQKHSPDNLVLLCDAVIYYAYKFLQWTILEEEHRGNFRSAVVLAVYLKEHAQDQDTPELLLYRTAFLRLLRQTPEKNYVRTHGFVMLLQEFQTLQSSPQAYREQTEFEAYQMIYTKFDRLFDDAAKKEKFYLTLNTLLTKKDNLRKFNAIVSVFSKLSLLSAWFDCLISLDEIPKILAHINTLFEQLGTENTLFNDLLILGQRLALLEDTSKAKQFYKLNQALLVFVSKLNLAELKNNGLPFTIPTILALVLRAVNTYDIFIKKLILEKHSTLDINKILFNYALLTLRIIKLLSKLTKRKINSKTLEDGVIKLIRSTTYTLSPDFDVRLYITNILNINVKHVNKYAGGFPGTAHDLLTILHQTNLAAIAEIAELSTEANSFGALENFSCQLIALGKHMHDDYKYLGADDAKLLLKASNDNADTCQYLFPLRHHGILVTVSKKRGAYTLDIDIKLFADNQQNRNNRLEKIVTLIAEHLTGTLGHTSIAGEEGYSLSFKADDTFKPSHLAELIYIAADVSCCVNYNSDTAYSLILQCEQTALKKITLADRERKKLCRKVVTLSIETKTLHPLLSFFLLDDQADIADVHCEALVPVVRNAKPSFKAYSGGNAQTRGHFLDSLNSLVKRGHGLVLARAALLDIFDSYKTLTDLSDIHMAGRYVRLLWTYEATHFQPLEDKYKSDCKKYFDEVSGDQVQQDFDFFHSLLDYLLATNQITSENIIYKYSEWTYHKISINPRHLIPLPPQLSGHLASTIETLVRISMSDWLEEEDAQSISGVIDALATATPERAHAMHVLLKHIDTMTEANAEKCEAIKKHIMHCLFKNVAHYKPEDVSVRMFTESPYSPALFLNHCLFIPSGKRLLFYPDSRNYIKEALAMLAAEEQPGFFLALFNTLNRQGSSIETKDETAKTTFIDFHLTLFACLTELPENPAITLLLRTIFCNVMQLRLDYHLYSEEEKLPEALFEKLLWPGLDRNDDNEKIKTLWMRLVSLLNCIFENYRQDLSCGFNSNYLSRTLAVQNMAATIIRALSEFTPFFRALFHKNRGAYDFFAAVLEKAITFTFRKEKPSDQIIFYTQFIKVPLQALQHALPSTAEFFLDAAALVESSATLVGASTRKRDEKIPLEKLGDEKKLKEDQQSHKSDDEAQESRAEKRAKKK